MDSKRTLVRAKRPRHGGAFAFGQAWAQRQGIALLYIQPGNPEQSAYIERYNRTIRHAWLASDLFNYIGQVQDIATR